ncbi:MAG: hypothetical protein H6719_14650 [Sandaracinaceae bacterium]|nr:hypothetical protein [Sandaracinaceae bacterium]
MGSLGLMRALPFMFLIVAGCAFDAPSAAPPTPVYEPAFTETVYPILLRDCGFPDCHGNTDRFFRVYGPGRTRLIAPTPENNTTDDPRSDAEVRASYERARSMLASAGRAEDSVLLRKPLEIDRGGAPHMGIDHHGQDVYQSVDDESYQAILQWARTGFPGSP